MDHKKSNNFETSIDDRILREICDTIKQIKFGEIVVTIHDRQIIQIEKKEKKRFK